MEIGILDPGVGDGALAEVTSLVNRVYAAAEKGLWRDGAARTTIAEMREFVADGEIFVTRLGDRIVGTIRVRRLAGGVGEFGMLTADPDHQGSGIGGGLIRFAERLSLERGLDTMQLELLVPKTWTHPSKKFLREWYSRLGYRIVRTGSIDEQYPALAPRLGTPCDYVIYHKTLI